jgi:outer membrane protein OmpA-like peptidoglycan-associated protein/tetratricopeptide (TPR) repeat protein
MLERKPKFNFLVFLFLLLSTSLLAQPELGECEQEVDEVISNQIPRALKAWKVKNYREVERYLEKSLRLDPTYAPALYLLGELNLRKGEIRKAKFLWEKLLKECPHYKPEIPYLLGVIYLESGEYEMAISFIEQFLANSERDFGFDKEAKTALKDAKLNLKLMANPKAFQPSPVQRISTSADEYLASISPDQKTMFFTRRSRKVNRKDGPAASARLVEEFCKAVKQANGEFEMGAPMPSPFNTSYNEGGPSITADNTELYFTVCLDIEGYKNCDIYYTELDPYGYWVTPKSVGDHINRRDSWESQASVTANGDFLYFTSNREEGQGGLDIYRCKRLPQGNWSAPVSLPAGVNTSRDEKSPFIHSDSKTLYFTSNGHPGLGGFDIFYVQAKTDSTWFSANNIGYPINSKDDDLGLFVSMDGKTGYFSSNTIRANTGWDLYKFELPQEARPDEVFLLSGKLSAEEGLDSAVVEIKNLKTKEVSKIRVDLETGNFARVLSNQSNDDFIIKVEKKGAAFSSRYISAESRVKEPIVEASLELKKLEIGREYTLNDINFLSNSDALDNAARAIIEEFVGFMVDNETVKADIQGHTDNVGDAGSNEQLSKKRAKAVFEYALSLGMSNSRLVWHGYGESRPIEPNDDDSGRAKNRRTVFVLTAH